MDEDGLNELEIFLDRMSSAMGEVGHIESSYLKGVTDGIKMVKGAIKQMREELA